MGKSRVIAVGILMLLPVVFFGSYLFRNSVDLSQQCQRNLDRQLIELSVERTRTFEAFGGAYSKQEFQHPGPAYFYYLGAFYQIWPQEGTQHGIFKIATVVFHLFVLVICALVTARLFPLSPKALIIFPFLVFSTFHESKGFLFSDYWNPYPNITLALLLILSSVAVSVGRSSYAFVVGMTLVGSLMIQNHIGAAPLVVFVLGASIGSWTYLRKKEGRLVFRSYIAWVAMAILLNVVLWLAPLYELLHYSDANLVRIAQSFGDAPAGKTLGRSLQLMSLFYSQPFVGIFSTSPKLLMLIVMFLPFFFWRVFDDVERALCVICLLCSVVTMWAGTRIFVPPQQYLISYFYAVPALQIFLILSGGVELITRRIGRRSAWSQTSVAACFSLVAIALLWLRSPGEVEVRRCAINAEVDALVQQIPRKPQGRYLISLKGEKAPYSFAAPLSLAMVRKGYDICFADEWGYRFGRSLTCTYRDKWYPTSDESTLEIERSSVDESQGFQQVLFVRGVRVRF